MSIRIELNFKRLKASGAEVEVRPESLVITAPEDNIDLSKLFNELDDHDLNPREIDHIMSATSEAIQEITMLRVLKRGSTMSSHHVEGEDDR